MLYLFVYGGMHVYLFLKVGSAFPELGAWRFALAGFLLAMVLAPLAGRLLERSELLRSARAVSLVGYSWMAILVWFCVLALAVGGWNLAVRAVSLAAPAAHRLLLPSRPALQVFGGIILVALVWGIVEASNIRLVRVSVRTPRLAPGSEPIRVAQISDLHLSLFMAESRLRRIVRVVEAARPDVLVCTGDMVDASFRHVNSLAALWADVKPPLGKFAVTGNHEFYNGLDESLAFLKAAGFRVLRGESVIVGGRLLLAGVDDPAGRYTGQACFMDEGAVLPAGEDHVFTILLKHQPKVSRDSLGRFDLQLSGHTHGGQIFPLGLVARMVYPLWAGFHALDRGSAAYVSRGTGTWGPPMRLFAPPEVTLITVEPAGNPAEKVERHQP
jgi:hypothetical protein